MIASGTSFAAPIVASGVSLLDSLSYHLSYTVEFSSSAANFANSRDSRVIKAVLMNSATKLPGWNNGQYTSGGVTYTEQALDTSQGAGMLNMNQAMNQYIGGTLDPFGYAGSVQPTGWSLATVASGGYTDYTIDTELPANSYLDVTLCWFRDRAVPGVGSATGDWDPVTSALGVTDLGMAKLDLQIWDSTFTTLYAESDTSYNNVQGAPLSSALRWGLRHSGLLREPAFRRRMRAARPLGWRGTTRWWCQSLPHWPAWPRRPWFC